MSTYLGPSTNYDTACSSSLVAMHAAKTALRQDIRRTCVSGTNLMLQPQTTAAICSLNALSPVGRCLTLDAAADGYGRGEGISVLLLESPKGKWETNVFFGIIRGSSVNQNGRSSGLSAPNGTAQTSLLTQALLDGMVAPEAVKLVSTHGTGTVLGDPIETNAILDSFKNAHLQFPLHLLSSKSHVGHMEGNAGMAGLLAAAVPLIQQCEVPMLNLRTINKIVVDSVFRYRNSALYIARNRGPLTQTAKDNESLGLINAFGMSGINANIAIACTHSNMPGAISFDQVGIVMTSDGFQLRMNIVFPLVSSIACRN